MADVFNFQFALTETAFQREDRGIRAAAEREAGNQVGAFEARDAVRICASRRQFGLESNRLSVQPPTPAEATYAPLTVAGVSSLSISTPIYQGGVVPATKAQREHAFLGWLGVSVDPQVVLGAPWHRTLTSPSS